MTAARVLVLNGPNLDMLGTREPDIYGQFTLNDLEEEVERYAEMSNVATTFYQSNSEEKLINRIHDAAENYDGIVYNPGAHTHYSYALRDAIASIDVPVVEVHLSAINDREPFRKYSVIAPACVAQVKGLGIAGYCRAIDILNDQGGEFLNRLGEGFEQRYDTQKNIVISSEAKVRAAAHAGTEGDAKLKRVRVIPGAPVAEQSKHAAKGSSVKPALVEGAQSVSAAAEDESAISSSMRRAAMEASIAAAQEEALRMAEDALAAQRSAEKAAHERKSQQRNFTDPYLKAIGAINMGLLSFERQAVVRKTVERLGIGALLVRDTSNIRWITAIDNVFDEERAHGLLITREGSKLHTDTRYSNAVRAAAARIGSDIVVNEERQSHAEFAYNALTGNGQVKLSGKLGLEDSISYAEFVKMVERFTTKALAPTSDIVLGLRAVKDSGEILRLKAAQAVTDAAFLHIIKYMKPGMTEREVQIELDDFMVRHGAESVAFRTIVATGANGADPHAVPGSARLEAGQCVVMDFGAKAFGYCSDMTRTVFLGAPEGTMARAWEVLRSANETVEAKLRPGVTGKQAHELAERVLESGGFGGKMGHGLGHGVGLDIHELPALNHRNEVPLVEGNVVTVEPGIYLPGQFGMRLEDCGVITAGGYEPFSQLGHEMVVI